MEHRTKLLAERLADDLADSFRRLLVDHVAHFDPKAGL
jgi:hypothetical protein